MIVNRIKAKIEWRDAWDAVENAPQDMSQSAYWLLVSRERRARENYWRACGNDTVDVAHRRTMESDDFGRDPVPVFHL